MDVEVVVAVLLHAAQRVELGQDDARSAPSVVEQRQARGRASAADERAAARRRRARPRRRRARRACARARRPRSRARRAKPSSRRGARRAARAAGRRSNAAAETIRRRRAARSAAPPCGSTSVAAGQRLGHRVDRQVARARGPRPAIAPWSGDEVDLPRARPDHAPGAEGVGEREGRAARGPRDARAPPPAGRRRARGRGRPRRRRRAAGRAPCRRRARPSSPASAARTASSGARRAHAGPPSRTCARGTRGSQPARDLVVDRAEPPGDLLGEHALAAVRAEQDDLVAEPRRRRRRPEVDGHVVHADRARRAGAGGRRRARRVVREPAAPAVAVADRDRGQHACRARRRSAGRSPALSPARAAA